MSAIKDVVKEKYGQAARRVAAGESNACEIRSGDVGVAISPQNRRETIQ